MKWIVGRRLLISIGRGRHQAPFISMATTVTNRLQAHASRRRYWRHVEIMGASMDTGLEIKQTLPKQSLARTIRTIVAILRKHPASKE